VGQLRQAFVHRSGLELSRLTSGNRDELLFDDVLTIAADGGRWRLWGRMGRSETDHERRSGSRCAGC